MGDDLPAAVTLIEVGPRDGFQAEETPVPLALKIETITGLLEAGFEQIQVTSFVNPRKVPQMADAEQLMARLPPWSHDRINALVLNRQGLDRARRTGVRAVEISVSASDTHSRRNTGMSRQEAAAQGQAMVKAARQDGLFVRASVQCAFGCVYEGPVPIGRVMAAAESFVQAGVDMLALADTTGMAHPLLIAETMQRFKGLPAHVPVALHLHDTRGLGLVNVVAGLQCGIVHFDVALGGMGGCPFVPGAAGNIATEDTLHLLQKLGIHTGIDLRRVADCSKRLAGFLGRPLPSKMYRLV